MIVCKKCGRRGSRGFVIFYGTGDGRDSWVCENRSACEKREARVRKDDPFWEDD